MSDLISRQAAIDLWEKYHPTIAVDAMQYDAELRQLPSAEKTGKWIEKEICETRRKEEMQVAKCSNCEKYLTTPYIYSFNHYNYCPHCGAKMGG